MSIYVCSLPNPGEPGRPHECIADDPRVIEAFAEREDKPGRGVYDCVSPLKPGARNRSLETVDKVTKLHFDIDAKDVVEELDTVDERLASLPLPPTEVRNSGHGRHVDFVLKEPADPSDPALAEVRSRLTNYLCGDRAVSHNAALMRRPGTHNSKNGAWIECTCLQRNDTRYDLFEIADWLDEVESRPLFTRCVAGNGHDKDTTYSGSPRPPIDVDARLAAMKFKGPGNSSIHQTQLSTTASLLRAGVALVETSRQVLAATRAAVAGDPRAAKWNWAREELKIMRMGCDFIAKHPELAILLPDNLQQAIDGPDKTMPQNDGPIPLFPPLPPAKRFPVEALGDSLSKAALAIAHKVQLPVAIAAQSVLAAAALAAQAIADVMMPYGDARPLSLFFITVAASGDRKTTADNSALWPIRKYEDALKEKYRTEYERWDVETATWTAERKHIEGNKKITRAERAEQLTRLGPKPPSPLQPFLTATEPTVEGLIKIWPLAPAALGIFSTEGGQFIGGYGMSPDHRLKTAATFSGMWDGAKISRVRAGDGSIILKGRRLSLHLMVQPDAAAAFLSDPVLRNQGLLSRILVAQPDSVAGTRLYRNTDTADEKTIRQYGERILSILGSPWPIVDGERNELDPPALTLDAEAFTAWKEFHDNVEARCGQHNELAAIGDFAAKAAEQAARIAGVLTIIDDRVAVEIKGSTMGDAVTITDWYVNETLRLQQAARTDAKLVRAQRLLVWLQARGGEIDLREIIQFGPAAERSKAAASETIAILLAHGWIRATSKRPYRVAVVQVPVGGEV
jgi:hypothetical protein